jgi:hypothetical protein
MFQHERSLVVAVDGTKKLQAKRLKERRDAVAACRGTVGLLGGKRVDERHSPFHTDLITKYGGDVVMLEDFAVVEPP